MNGTSIVAAAALREDLSGNDRAFVDSAIQRATATLPTYFKLFSYDPNDSSRNGAYPEGPTYLNYSLEYLALAESAIEASRGALPRLNYSGTGVREGATYALDMLSSFAPLRKGPGGIAAGLSINYSDGSSTIIPSSPVQSWFGLRHGKTESSTAAQYFAKATLPQTVIEAFGAYTVDALSVLWFTEVQTAWNPVNVPVKIYGSEDGRNSMAILRRSPSPNLSLFAVLKGGMALETPHGHMDAGSFFLEALDRRWSFDLSHESYSAPNYFRTDNVFPNRWDYLRANNRGHSTLTIDGQLHNPTGIGRVTLASTATETESAAVVNLSSVFRGQATSVRRRLAATDSGEFVLKDVLSGVTPGESILWQMIYCRGVNSGRNVCYSDDDRNPIVVDPIVTNKAVIAEEMYSSTTCSNPRRMEVTAVSPSNAVLVSSKLIAPDLIIPGRNGGPSTTYQQEDNAKDSKCYALLLSVQATTGDTTVELKFSPKRRNDEGSPDPTPTVTPIATLTPSPTSFPSTTPHTAPTVATSPVAIPTLLPTFVSTNPPTASPPATRAPEGIPSAIPTATATSTFSASPDPITVLPGAPPHPTTSPEPTEPGGLVTRLRYELISAKSGSGTFSPPRIQSTEPGESVVTKACYNFQRLPSGYRRVTVSVENMTQGRIVMKSRLSRASPCFSQVFKESGKFSFRVLVAGRGRPTLRSKFTKFAIISLSME